MFLNQKMKGTTKGTKVKPTAAAKEEECGIWLDTTELKEKKQQKKLTPISKLLNPLARSEGYNVAVAFSFTQTKLNMPVTRQSTISSFFSPKTEESKPSSTHNEMGTSTHTELTSGVKRKHEATLEPDISASQTFQVDRKNSEDDENIPVKEIKEQSFLHLMCGYASDEEEPPGKRKAFASHADHNVLETQEYWKHEVSPKSRNPITIPDTETLFNRDFNVEDCEDFPHVLGDINTRSVLTCRPINANLKSVKQQSPKSKASPKKRLGKENQQPASPNSRSSPFKRKLILSPAKCRLKEKYSHSLNDTEIAGDHSMLFTQDSEGFCVIAHRDQNTKSPVKDHDNVSVNTDSWNRYSEESDLEAEMLFTQDSEGNMVIKHS